VVFVVNRRRSASEVICRIDVTAFASVMLVLIAVFVLPATIIVDSSRDAAHVPVDLARVSNPTDMTGINHEDALVVSITRDGQIWLGRDQVAPENLPAAIRKCVAHGAERKVYIRADMRARFGGVARVLASVRAAGIERVGFIVDKRIAHPVA
jgi:biopolymer transport protein TolR